MLRTHLPLRTLLAPGWLVCALALTGCSEAEDRFGEGFDAGYAAGYDRRCGRSDAPLREDFDDEDQALGYAAGVESGTSRCERDRRAGRIR